MTELAKATLVKLTAGENPREDGAPISVQFNPATLRLALSNETEGGRSRGRQERQFTGISSSDLTFELVFDTADESIGDNRPRSVREKTAQIEQFIIATPDARDRNRRIIPPRVRFAWGDFRITGIMKTLSIDFDLFAADGTPLRAKMNVSIKEQNPEYELRVQDATSDPPPGGAAPGGDGTGPTDRTASALEGESAADFAARAGLDPGAWRGVAAALEGTLSLQAGVELDFSAGLSLGTGLSAGFSFEAGASLSLEASFGLEASAGAGFALSAAGGVSAAAETVQNARNTAAADNARAAFAAQDSTSPPPPVRPAMPEQTRSPLRTSDASSPIVSARTGGASAPPPPLADPRASSYGFGVPLRPRQTPALDRRTDALAGRAPLRPYVRSTEVEVTNDPGAAPWERLPAYESRRAPSASRSCGCKSPCKCGGGSCR